jgi:pSer/pThr/pTyr-binding forkhead associated (FHA) protein
MVQKVEIVHNDVNLGQIYLSDVGRRNSLGGGVSIYEHGQDQYLNPGDTIELVATSQVLLSIDRGVLKTFSTGDNAGELTITFL